MSIQQVANFSYTMSTQANMLRRRNNTIMIRHRTGVAGKSCAIGDTFQDVSSISALPSNQSSFADPRDDASTQNKTVTTTAGVSKEKTVVKGKLSDIRLQRGCGHCWKQHELDKWDATTERISDRFYATVNRLGVFYVASAKMVRNVLLHVFRQVLIFTIYAIEVMVTLRCIETRCETDYAPVILIIFLTAFTAIQNLYFAYLHGFISDRCCGNGREETALLPLLYTCFGMIVYIVFGIQVAGLARTDETLSHRLGTALLISGVLEAAIDTETIRFIHAIAFIGNLVFTVISLLVYAICYLVYYCFRREHIESYQELEAVLREHAVRYTSDMRSGRCAICYEDYSCTPEKRVVELDCSHVLHETCAKEWLTRSRRNVCPTCQGSVFDPEAWLCMFS